VILRAVDNLHNRINPCICNGHNCYVFRFRQMSKNIEISTICDLCWYTEKSEYGKVCYVNN
jgi:hypothetical protein